MKIGNYEVIFVSNVSGEAVERIGGIFKAIYNDITADWHKPFWNLSWKVMARKIDKTDWFNMPIDSEEAQLDLPF